MCAAPAQGPTLPAGIDLTKETVIFGTVTQGRAAGRRRLRPAARLDR